MASNIYSRKTVDGKTTFYSRKGTQGRHKLPIEIKSVRVNITLTPQAKRRGFEKAKSCGKTFSAWIEDQIYKSIHTEIS